MKLFLDDMRVPDDCLLYMYDRPGVDPKIYTEKWNVVTNYDEFVEAIEKNKGSITHISFDHDLSDEHYHPDMYRGTEIYNILYNTFKEKTGYDCAKWFKQYYVVNNLQLPEIIVHTQNPAGYQNITNLFS